ncbi:unnamed protein product [Sympodiomycopsis kandeliae]
MPKLKERLRLVDPNEQEVASDVGTHTSSTSQEKRAMESSVMKHFDHQEEEDEDADADADEDETSTAFGVAPTRTIRNRTAEDEASKEKAAQAEAAAKQAKQESKAARRRNNKIGGAGLLSRLKTIRKKETDVATTKAPTAKGKQQQQQRETPVAVPVTTSTAAQKQRAESKEATPRASVSSTANRQSRNSVVSTSSVRSSNADGQSRNSVAMTAPSQLSLSPTSSASPLPGPSETLGINAFQRNRVSTNASLVTTALLSNGQDASTPTSRNGDADADDDDDGDGDGGVDDDRNGGRITPSLSALRTHPLLVDPTKASHRSPASPSPALQLRDQGVERQPDLIETAPSHIKRSSTQRYSIAHSVEASLEDSWSIAEKDDRDIQDDDDDDDDDDQVDDDEYASVDWLKGDAEPPMVGQSVIGSASVSTAKQQPSTRPAFSTRTISGATMKTAQTHATPSESSRATSDNDTIHDADEDEEDDDDDESQQDRQSDVNRLLKQLELGTAAGAGAAAVSAATPRATRKSLPPRPDSAIYTDDEPEDVSGIETSSSIATSDIDTRISARNSDLLYPDDSVSIRAAHRAAAADQADAGRLYSADVDEDDGAATPTLARTRAARPTDPSHLKAVLADIEPALESESEPEEQDEDEDTDGTEDGTETQKRAAPPIAARPRRRVQKPVDAIRSNPRRQRAQSPTALGQESWLLDSALTPEQYHYYIKAMVKEELRWETDRAFVFDRADDRSGSVDPQMKVREYAVFKRSALASDNIPALPLVRFLFDTVFCMLPVFGHASTAYEKRQQRAQAFWKRSVSPLLRIIQSRSFSQRGDRFGESNGKPFDGQDTGDILSNVFRKFAASYITATLRLDGGRDDVKQSWPWPSANLMKLPAFTPYRLAPENQTRGGYEVDIAVVRPDGQRTSYIISVKRRFGHPLSFVLRSEEQFGELGKALFLSLPGSYIKPPPPIDLAVVRESDTRMTRTVTSPSNAASSTVVQASNPRDKTKKNIPQDTASKRNGQASRATEDAKRKDAVNAPEAKPGGLAGFFGSFGRSAGSSAQAGTAPPSSVGSSTSIDDGLSATTATASPSTVRTELREREAASAASKKRMSLWGSKSSLPLSADGQSGASPTSPVSPMSAGGSAAGLSKAGGSGKTSKTGGLFGLGGGSQANPAPAPQLKQGSIDYALRRLQLRDWLRDVLSARGVGHHPETRNFFSVGAFTERDLKRSTKEKWEKNRQADAAATKQREDIALTAGEEVLDLRDQMDAMWEECKMDDGFLKARAVFSKSSTFSGLPEDYQRLVTYLHLQAARMLDGMFITGDQSANNLRRARAVMNVIPWKLLKVVMSQPTGLMIADLKRTLSHPSFISKILDAAMQDDRRRVDERLGELKARLPGDYLRKLRRFVEVTPDDTKRLIRDQAAKSGIPLVAAIERGSDSPLLEGRELSRIISATKAWQAFMETKPTALEVQIEAGQNRDVALIRDLQSALRLYSIRRDGANMRDLVRSKTFRRAIESLTQPIFDYIAKLHHRRQPVKRFIRTLQMRLDSLLELLEALRNRIHDPARSIEALTTFFDSHVQDSMSLLRILSPLFTTLHHMAHTVEEGSLDLAREWPLPSSKNSFNPLGETGLRNIKSLADSGWLARIRSMEVTSRWIAGDLEADSEVQVIGGQGELSRTSQILPDEPENIPLDRETLYRPFAAGFREALGKVLA